MSSPDALTPESFSEFFHALWGYDPFPWQQDFATRICAGQAPDYVTVPTGSGKTACLDAAVFALAVQASRPVAERTAGRRIFFIVNRRIIVNEAFERAKKLAKKLSESLKSDISKSGVIARVAWWLKQITGDHSAAPLACTELRGGIYRDRAWAKSMLQPMIICSTIDQAGSRLLFRGYGVSHEARPIHAALVAHDSLLLIDEAHISQPFLQTLDWVKRYRLHQANGSKVVALPFAAVKLTATPPKDDQAIKVELTEKDRAHPLLNRRLNASKPVRQVVASKAKGKNATEELAKILEAEASALIAQQLSLSSIAVMVNRVATAREVTALLTKKHSQAKITLVLGRMRPLDRDQVTKELQDALKTGTERPTHSQLQIVVSTQCLEVGADLDFDALVTECASIDALRQRFGRLNRDGRDIPAKGVIVLSEEQRIDEAKLSDDKPADPIYGNAIPRTWCWLQTQAVDGSVDFGLNSMTAAVAAARSTDDEKFNQLLMPRENAPILLPAHLDCWAQTNPAPAADPEVSFFLHGPQRDMAEVQVCWRADIPEDGQYWPDILSLCPPTNLECLPVPLHLMRQWLEKGDSIQDDSGDAPAETEEDLPLNESKRKQKAKMVSVLIWSGKDESDFASNINDIRPGQTLVLRAAPGCGWETLGHVPAINSSHPSLLDRAEEAQAKLNRRAYVRLHPAIFGRAGDNESPIGKLLELQGRGELQWSSSLAEDGLQSVIASLAENTPFAKRLRHLLHHFQKLKVEAYPDGSGVVLSVRDLLPPSHANEEGPMEDGPSEPLLNRLETQSLSDHTVQVMDLAERYSMHLGLVDFKATVTAAARLHDIGKVDPRFQAMLIQGNLTSAYAQPFLWAKSDKIPDSIEGRERARERAGLPKRFRHEMLSLQLALLPEAKTHLPESDDEFALSLHLIASHHGHARPFAPIVFDDEPPPIEPVKDTFNLGLSTDARLTNPAHALDSGVAERFWQLTRQHGWWGLSLLEAVLRLADQTASANPESQTEK